VTVPLKRIGMKKSKVAIARELSSFSLVDGTAFEWGQPKAS
jgi:hypothetical protein